MEAREILKKIQKEKGLTNAEYARLLDVTPATLWDRLNNKKGRKDIPASLLIDMLEPLGYEVCVRDKNTGALQFITKE